MFDEQNKMTDYELLHREFCRIHLFAHQVSRSARNHKRQGKEEEFRGAMSAFRVLAKRAKEVEELMASVREPRPAIIDTDVAIEQDMRLTVPELFLSPEDGGFEGKY